MKERAAQFGMPPEMLEKNELVLEGGYRSLEICQRAGVKVAYGTDLLGALAEDQSREFSIRASVVSPIEIIRSATLIGAEVVRRQGQLGVIDAGAWADLIVVDGDPLADISLLEASGSSPVGHHEGRRVPQEPLPDVASCEARWRRRERRELQRSTRRLGAWLLNAVAGLTLAFILTPLFFVTWLSFFRQEIPSFPPEGYSLRWYAAIAGNDRFVDGFLLSLQLGVIATLHRSGRRRAGSAVPVALPLSRPRARSTTCC